MKVECKYCKAPHDLDDHSAGKTIRCATCGKSFVAPKELSLIGQNHSLQSLPVPTVLLLHYVSAGIFTIIHLNLLHERMPRLRHNDPSSTVAVGLSFVPIANLLWFYFSFHRLCLRINEQRRLHGMPPAAPEWLSIPVCTLLVCGVATVPFVPVLGIALLGMLGLFVMPAFVAGVQTAVNELCELPAEPIIAT